LHCNVTANTDIDHCKTIKPTTNLSGSQIKGLGKERRQSSQNKVNTLPRQNTAPRQVEKQMQKTLTSVDEMELKSLPLTSKDLE